jgi:hypothetical protein
MNISTRFLGICGIYRITTLKGGKRYYYIGSSKNIYHRLHRHKSDLRRNKHQNIVLQNIFNKNGENCFYVEVLEKCCESKLSKREQHYVNTTYPLLNITKEVIRNTLSKSSRKKISETLKRKNKSGEIKHSGTPKKKIDMYSLDGDFIKSFASIRDASKELNLFQGRICQVCKRQRKSTGGYQFRYEGEKCTKAVSMKCFSIKYEVIVTISGKVKARINGIYNLYLWLKKNLFKYPDKKYSITTKSKKQPNRIRIKSNF